MSKSHRYFDIHGHVNFPEYGNDQADVIRRAQDAGVAMITVGTDLGTSQSAVVLAEQHENMWATVGIHPTHTKEVFSQDAFRELTAYPKVVAIGECGLDYFRSKPEDREWQKRIFEQQIALANEIRKPLILHVRNGKNGEMGQNAYADALAMLAQTARVPFNFHFFAGTAEDLKNIITAGGYVSFTGVLTFTSDYDQVVREAPLDRIMSETDCPFVAPAPYRGRRNEPGYVIEVVKAIARIRGESEDVVAAQLATNAQRFFFSKN
jgi:TatD DNase family protein